MLATAANVLGAIAWDPEIRNLLSVMVGLGVLLGSVYLIVGSNTGLRTGLLITLAALFGWMTIMGVIWWIYGIGMKGDEAAWHVQEINYSDAADYEGLAASSNTDVHRLTGLAEIPTVAEILEEEPELIDTILPVAELTEEQIEARAQNITYGQILEADPTLVERIDEPLAGWELLPQSDRQRGDAVATAQAFVGPDERSLFEATTDYLVQDAFSYGGKERLGDTSLLHRAGHKLHSIFVQPFHPTHYAVVQLRGVIPVEVEAGQTAPIPEIDPEAPLVSVVMVRDLGDKRFPAFMITLVFGLLFAITCWTLHRRDAVIAARRAATA